MNIRQQLLKRHSRENADFIEDHVVRTPGAIVELMVCFLGDETKVAQRSSQVVGNLGRNHPEMLQPWWEEMIDAGDTPIHIAIRRNVARYFSELELPIPAPLEKRIADSFTQWSTDSNVPVAVAVLPCSLLPIGTKSFPRTPSRSKRKFNRAWNLIPRRPDFAIGARRSSSSWRVSRCQLRPTDFVPS